MKKIILFHTEFFFSGGAEHTILDTLDFLNSQGYEAIAYAPYVNYATCFPDRINQTTVKQLLPNWITRLPLPRDIFIFLAAICAPILVFQFKSASIFYGANQLGPVFAYIASRIHHKPYLVYMPYPQGFIYPRKIDREFGPQDDLHPITKGILTIIKPIFKKIDFHIIRAANVVITEGIYSYNLFTQLYQREIINCPPGTNPVAEQEILTSERFTGQIEVNNIVIHKPYLLVTNRHMPKKKFEYAIQAASTFHNIQLVITGALTEYTRQLHTLITQLKTENIIFTGYTSEQDTQKLYRNAAVYLYPAPEEDFGKGIIQAMACAVPVVAWNNAGPSKIIDTTINGITVTPFNSDEFTNQVKRLLEDRELNYQMGKNAWNKAKSEFSTEKHNQTLLNCIINLLSHPHTRLLQ